MIAQNPGRSLHRIPGPGPTRISFVHKVGEKEWFVKALDPRSKAITTLINTLPGSEDVAWTPDGVLLSGRGSKLFEWDAKSKATEWREIADLGPVVRQITRIAVSPKGDRIALVAADALEGSGLRAQGSRLRDQGSSKNLRTLSPEP